MLVALGRGRHEDPLPGVVVLAREARPAATGRSSSSWCRRPGRRCRRCTYGIRWADVIATSWMCPSAVPKMAAATSLAMSMSKPSISPSLRYGSRTGMCSGRRRRSAGPRCAIVGHDRAGRHAPGRRRSQRPQAGQRARSWAVDPGAAVGSRPGPVPRTGAALTARTSDVDTGGARTAGRASTARAAATTVTLHRYSAIRCSSPTIRPATRATVSSSQPTTAAVEGTTGAVGPVGEGGAGRRDGRARSSSTLWNAHRLSRADREPDRVGVLPVSSRRAAWCAGSASSASGVAGRASTRRRRPDALAPGDRASSRPPPAAGPEDLGQVGVEVRPRTGRRCPGHQGERLVGAGLQGGDAAPGRPPATWAEPSRSAALRLIAHPDPGQRRPTAAAPTPAAVAAARPTLTSRRVRRTR